MAKAKKRKQERKRKRAKGGPSKVKPAKKRVKSKKPQPKRNYKKEYARKVELRKKRKKPARKAPSKKTIKRAAKKHVAKIRKRKPKAATHTLSKDQLRTIKNWYQNKFNPLGHRKVPQLNELIEWTQENGYKNFEKYRSTWNGLRSAYLARQKKSSVYVKTVDLDDLIDEDFDGDLEPEWLYYH